MSIAWIDGNLYEARLPSGGQLGTRTRSDWDRIMKETENDKDGLLHATGTYSICSDLCLKRIHLNRPLCIVRGHDGPKSKAVVGIDFRSSIFAFRPMLIPLDKQTMRPDTKLSAIPSLHTRAFGTLYMDDVPVHVPLRHERTPHYELGAEIHIGDSDRVNLDNIIRWIKTDRGWIADRALLVYVSWSDLDRNGFIAEP